MAAGLGFKTFTTGEVLTAADTNGYLMQGVLVFANAAARTAAVTSPQEGQTSYLKDTDEIQVYSGSAWVTKSGSTPTSAVATVATDEQTSSSSYTDLTTSGPAVTLTTGTKVLVIMSALAYTDGANQQASVDFAVSGATTRAASDATRLSIRGAGAGITMTRASSASRITVTAGSNTFTAKYKTSAAGTAYFSDRQILVIDLGS